jgi:hypothetical protein
LAFLAKRYLQFTRYELFVSSQASSQ